MRTRIAVISDTRAADGPYGIDLLEGLGYVLTQASPARHAWHRKLRDVIEHRTGVPSEHVLRSMQLVRDADVVLAFLESHAQLPSALRARRIRPFATTPLVMIACWLADDLRRLPATERRRLAGRYRGVDLTMVFSANQIDVLIDAGFHEGSVEAIPFGFAPQQHPPVDFGTRDSSIVAVGFDRGRDYTTLFEAVQGTDLHVDLYCSEGNIAASRLPENVTFHGVVPYDEYRAVISRAGIVAVPTSEMAYPSGQTVALEAAATGACIALTSTPALLEYFSPATALLLPAHDPRAWRAGLLRAAGDPAVRERLGSAACDHVHAHFTYESMWRHVDALFRSRGWVREG